MSEFDNLQKLFDFDWSWEIEDNPEFASQAGQHDFIPSIGRELQDLSPAAYAARGEHSKRMVEAVRRIQSHGDLNESEKIYAALFERMHSDIVAALDLCPFYLFPINSMGCGGPGFSFLESIEWMRFEKESDFELYLRRLRAFPRQLEQMVESLRRGVEVGFVASKAMCRDVDAQIAALVSGTFPECTAPLLAEPGPTILAENGTLNSQLTEAIAALAPAFESFLQFFRNEYSQHLREDPACNALPNGSAAYSLLLRFHTTTDLSPDQIHDIGLSEVAKIEQRYRDDVMIPLGFDPDNFPAFVEFVREDRQFYVTTVEALLDVYRAQCAKIQALLPQYFSEIPKSPLEITSKQAGPAAYYLAGTADGKRPGRFYVNVSHLDKRPVYEHVSLSLHEAIPGHHHQISIGLENESIPNFLRFIEDRRYEVCPCRRNIYCGFSEGWALYCEHLGEEMGVYTSPYEVFGRLSMEMMRAVRLVVDTGIHAKGWSIEQCIDYMMLKTGMHRHEVETEIYRYATWPGQACAYKIGQIEMLRLRRHAEAALGDKFNLKDFHTLCLTSGPLPLSILADMVENFIQQRS